MKTFLCLAALTFWMSPVQAQWIQQNSGTEASFRAVGAVSDQVCWVGGSKGTILRTVNGGETWEPRPIPNAETLDFRDIHAFSVTTAVAMSAGEASEGKARIYRTTDGGQTWQLVFQTRQKGVFLDGLDFWDEKNGLCFSDPIDGKFYVLTTDDGGKTWQETPRQNFPPVLPGEAAFAASGTSIVALKNSQTAWIGTGGGHHARVFRTTDRGQSWQVSETPLPADASSGIFGIRFWSEKAGIAVGGDYKNEKDSTRNVLLTSDGGKTWRIGSAVKPGGLKESTALVGTNLLAVGPSGTSLSRNFGQTWQALDTSAFHAVSFAGTTGWAVGSNGAIARFDPSILRKK
ncbi:MAG: oxidoreductase [Cytophagaceae bacterium]|nr:oxidoreductase [Cytophagaceae bacterium]